MAELAFERMAVALETTRGTAVTPPTHNIPMAGTITPVTEIYSPPDQVGELAEAQREEIVRKSATWAAEGALDIYLLPLLLNMLLAPVTSPSTPSGATLSRLFEFVRVMGADTIKSATAYWGDPNQALYKAAFAMLTEITIGGDASGTDGVGMGLSGIGQFPSQLTGGSIPTLPTVALAPLHVPGRKQLWIDTSSAIGTTEITGRVISANGVLRSGVVPKFVATGPAGGVTYDHVGRAKVRPELTVVVEMRDQAQYTLYENGTDVKMRVRWNGPLIEAGFYHYVEQDIYGKLRAFSWGELEGVNRTMEFTVMGVKNAALGSDTRVAVQTTKTGL